MDHRQGGLADRAMRARTDVDATRPRAGNGRRNGGFGEAVMQARDDRAETAMGDAADRGYERGRVGGTFGG